MAAGRRVVAAGLMVSVLIASVCGADVPVPHPLTMLLRDTGVRRELALRPDQIAAVEAAIDEVERPLWLLRDLPPEKRQEPAGRLVEQLQGKLAGTLSAQQRTRLDQLVLQARGLQTVLDPEVAKWLELSAAQSRRIGAMLDALAQELAALQRNGAVTHAADRVRRRTREGEREVLAVLTKQQRDTLRTLRGAAYDLSRVRQVACRAPELQGVDAWINAGPVTLAELRGRVVVVHFYAFGCINCVRNLPHYNAWFDYFARDPLTIVGIHRPETQSERIIDEVRRQAIAAGLKHSIAVDNQSRNWDAWANQIWPSVYLIDKQGFIRYWWYGELNWQGSEGEKWMRRKIAELLRE